MKFIEEVLAARNTTGAAVEQTIQPKIFNKDRIRFLGAVDLAIDASRRAKLGVELPGEEDETTRLYRTPYVEIEGDQLAIAVTESRGFGRDNFIADTYSLVLQTELDGEKDFDVIAEASEGHMIADDGKAEAIDYPGVSDVTVEQRSRWDNEAVLIAHSVARIVEKRAQDALAATTADPADRYQTTSSPVSG